MDTNFIESIQEKLKTERSEIVRSLSAQSDDMKNLIKPQESGDEVDVASDAIDRNLLDSLGAKDAERLNMIDSALERIRLGRYGICISCGKEIPKERLEVLPYTVMCVNCASAAELKRLQTNRN
ncbi:MAG: TraR/DksA family transcriptional regulator [Spirochaetia bacterium]|nr:TraR/DksA family transcriptional regulator [Spirochaetia bacterium]MDD5777600.1 TraR/DksA family transcriptional regulator [Treponema sp.]MCI5608160.1 TraR/DksA family transcriptional regulator [Spirochaetia bacterium]MCI6826075.1 TraR/DksA family transcriptional regulator [Spirochaetia bacterium]MCI7110164.1 TraR/DksA family transcriptional regulator [Spirochaetia bacterium]